NLQAKIPHGFGDRPSATNRARWAVERGEEPVAGRVELTAAKARELSSYTRMVLGDQLAPAAVAEVGQSGGGADDVGEQDRGKHAIPFDDIPLAALPHAAQEAFH